MPVEEVNSFRDVLRVELAQSGVLDEGKIRSGGFNLVS